jgi:hypothetical protein
MTRRVWDLIAAPAWPLVRRTRRLAGGCAARWARLRSRPDAGYTTETVLITALLVVLAATTAAVITAKVLAKVRGISLD